jgi:hypothetical protein
MNAKTHMAFLLAKPTPDNVNHDNDRFSMFNKKRDIHMQMWFGVMMLGLPNASPRLRHRRSSPPR